MVLNTLHGPHPIPRVTASVENANSRTIGTENVNFVYLHIWKQIDKGTDG